MEVVKKKPKTRQCDGSSSKNTQVEQPIDKPYKVAKEQLSSLAIDGSGSKNTQVQQPVDKPYEDAKEQLSSVAIAADSAKSEVPESPHCEETNSHAAQYKQKKLYPYVVDIEQRFQQYHEAIMKRKQELIDIVRKLASENCITFYKEIEGIDRLEFYDMLKHYASASQKLICLRSECKCVESNATNLDLLSWNSKDVVVNSKGKCDDGCIVDLAHTYSIKKLDITNNSTLRKQLYDLEISVLPNLLFQEYTVQLQKLKIDSEMYESVKPFLLLKAEKKTRKDLLPSHYATMALMKNYLSILFNFQRYPTSDNEFILNTRKWSSDLMTVIIHYGTLDDQLFLLNHILRCPSGIADWAVRFIQLTEFPHHPFKDFEMNEGSTYYNFSTTILSMIFSPVPGREQMLSHLPPHSTSSMRRSRSSVSSDNSFTILSCEGNEEEDKFKFVKDWTESDVIGLMNQISISFFFNSILHMSHDDYNVSKTNEEDIEKIIAFTYFLLDVLICGLEIYQPQNFSNLVTIIETSICDCVRIVSYHWHSFKKHNIEYNCALQIEYDRLVFYTMHFFYSNKQYNILKSAQYLPCHDVSPKMLWNLLWLFHQPLSCSEEQVYLEKDVDIKLRGSDMRCLLFSNLDHLRLDDALAVLCTIEKLALYDHAEKELVCCIAQELFELPLKMVSKDDDILKKRNESLLKLIEVCPYTVSHLLEFLDADDNETVLVAQLLFKDVCIANWVPKNEDIEVLSGWLLCGSLSSEKNLLSRHILSKLNWTYQNGSLVLPLDLHQQVALLVVKAYTLYDVMGNSWPIGIDQMLQLWSSLRCQSVLTDKGFVSWAWELLFSLKLHILNHPSPPWNEIFDGILDFNGPDIHRDQAFVKLLSDCTENQPAACFVVLAMTNVGHSQVLLEKEGLKILSTLIALKQYAAAVQLLYFILPFFVKAPEKLIERRSFLLHLADLIISDAAHQDFRQDAVNGAVLTQLSNMIKMQVLKTQEVSIEFSRPLIKLWVNLLVSTMLMETNIEVSAVRALTNQAQSLLDSIIKLSFLHTYTLDGVFEVLSQLIKGGAYLCEPKSQSFFKIFVRVTPQVSRLLKDASSNFPWYAWCVIQAENDEETVKNLWLCMKEVLTCDTMCNADQAFRKVSEKSSKKLTIQSIPIYRWITQALMTPINHPLFPLVCQNFFFCYFQRMHGSRCLGPRFFESKRNQATLSEFVKKLKTAATCHLSLISQASCENKKSDDPHCLTPNVALETSLFKLFKAFLAWIEDPTMLDIFVSLPALDPKYLPAKLQLLFNTVSTPWFEYVDLAKLKEETIPQKTLWNQPENVLSSPVVLPCEDPAENIKKCIKPIEGFISAPTFDSITIPPVIMSVEEITDWKTLPTVVNKDQHLICESSLKFGNKILEMSQLNDIYLELVPKKYSEVLIQETFNRPCSKAAKCAGHAKFEVEFQITVLNDQVEKKIYHNRFEFVRLMNELKLTPMHELCVSALHMETCLKTLVAEIYKRENNALYEKKAIEDLRQLGISLFYAQLEQVQDILSSTTNFIASIQFFSTCIDSLGYGFIIGKNDECLRLVKIILKYPKAAELASKFLAFHEKLSVEVFTAVYKVLVEAALDKKTDPCIVSMLMSKIDMELWLKHNAPPFMTMHILLRLMGQGLEECGSTHQKLPVYDIFKKHFCAVFLHQFPEMFLDVIDILMQYSDTMKLNTDVWDMLFRCLGCFVELENFCLKDIKRSLCKCGLNTQLPPNERVFVSGMSLHIDQVIECLNFFTQHFTIAKNGLLKDLYKEYKKYINAIAVFLGLMCHLLLGVANDNYHIPGDLKCQKNLFLWNTIYRSFEPWINPTTTVDNIRFPWSPEYEPHAQTMLDIFFMTIEFHHVNFKVPDQDNSLISYVWKYYLNTFIEPAFCSYGIDVWHNAFRTVSWQLFQPSASDMKGICQLLVCEIPECRGFISEILLKLSWTKIITDLSSVKAPTPSSTISMRYLAELAIRSSWEYSIILSQRVTHQAFVDQLNQLPWFYLDFEMVEELVEIFCHLCKPGNMIYSKDAEWPMVELYVLMFLKPIVCMCPTASETQKSFSEKSQQKRVSFIKKLCTILGNYASQNQSAPEFFEKFGAFIVSMMEDVEKIVQDQPPTVQVEIARPLVTEVSSILNIVKESTLKAAILDALVKWIMSHVHTPLLGPMISTASDSLKDVSAVVTIVENCIEARYKTELEDPKEAKDIWHVISAFYKIPNSKYTEKFFEICFEQKAFFVLYAYIIQRISVIDSCSSRIMLLRQMVQWAKLMYPDENSEAKLLLIWNKLLEQALIVASKDDMQIAHDELIHFCGYLNMLGEDREKTGILAVIGLGKKSPLSVNFRLISRALCAFLYFQMPDLKTIRLLANEPTYLCFGSDEDTLPCKHPRDPTNYSCALGMMAYTQLNNLLENKSYTVLQSLTKKAIKYVADKTVCIFKAQCLMKELALQLYRDKPFLHMLEE